MYNYPDVPLEQYNKALKLKKKKKYIKKNRRKHHDCGISDKNKLPGTKHGQTSDEPKLRDILIFFKNMKIRKKQKQN